jgi:hypothetical protein
VQLAEVGRRQQLTDRAPAPPARTPFIPNGPFSSPPANPQDAGAGRPSEAELSHDRSAIWLSKCRHRPLRPRRRGERHPAIPDGLRRRRLAVVAGLEAAIPDAAALVFACLGVALALHGLRARD